MPTLPTFRTIVQGQTMKHAWLCFALAFPFFFGRLRSFTDQANRMEMAWTPTDVIVVYAAAALLAFGVFFAWRLMKRLGLPSAVISRSFIVVAIVSLGCGLSVFLIRDLAMWQVGLPSGPFDFPQISATIFYGEFFSGLLRYAFILLGVYGLSLGVKPLKHILVTTLLILSPVALVYPLTTLTHDASPMERGRKPSAHTGTDDANGRIFFFLFDGWDYKNTFHNSLGPIALPGVENLNESATLHHHAITPSMMTSKSVPGMIGGFGRENIFTQARHHGWTTNIVAGFCPYQEWYGEDADYCLRVVWEKIDTNIFKRVAWEIRFAFVAALQFWAPETGKAMAFAEDARHHLQRTQKTHKKTLDILSRSQPNSLNYFHYPIPHWPFFEEPELKRAGLPKRESQVRGYRGNLKEMDRTILELIAALKKLGYWDTSLVIFTSDHGWRWDPARPRELIDNKHVPLYIKRPGQEAGREDFDHYDMRNIKDMLVAHLAKTETKQ